MVQEEASLTMGKGAVRCPAPVLRYRFGFVFRSLTFSTLTHGGLAFAVYGTSISIHMCALCGCMHAARLAWRSAVASLHWVWQIPTGAVCESRMGTGR